MVVLTILKNMKVNGKDDIPDIMENKINVPNHQPLVNRLETCEIVKFWPKTHPQKTSVFMRIQPTPRKATPLKNRWFSDWFRFALFFVGDTLR